MRARDYLAKLAAVCGISFLLNLMWENTHYLLYVHYQGGPITEAVLLHATFVDAAIITAVVAIFVHAPSHSFQVYGMVGTWLLMAIGIEWWALETARWAYQDFMPTVPLLGVGLSPTVQLALTGYVSYFLVFRHRRHG